MSGATYGVTAVSYQPDTFAQRKIAVTGEGYWSSEAVV
jgi:hypothetical protein